MENVINITDVNKFKEEIKLFYTLTKEREAAASPKFEVSDYLKWCEIQRMDKLIELKSTD